MFSSIAPEQFEVLPFWGKIIVFIMVTFELCLTLAKVTWPIVIWMIFSVLKDIRNQLKKSNK